jgi:hypothetical protein
VSLEVADVFRDDSGAVDFPRSVAPCEADCWRRWRERCNAHGDLLCGNKKRISLPPPPLYVNSPPVGGSRLRQRGKCRSSDLPFPSQSAGWKSQELRAQGGAEQVTRFSKSRSSS